MNCWKPKVFTKAISSQAPILKGKVQRLSERSTVLHYCKMGSASLPTLWGDDIVHSLKKFRNMCNPLVVGSIPTLGAKIFEVFIKKYGLVRKDMSVLLFDWVRFFV